MPRIVIIGMDGCLGSAMLGAADALRLARGAVERLGGTSPALEVVTASLGGLPITDGHGTVIAVDMDLMTISSCSAFLVPGFVPEANGLPPEMGHQRAILHWMRERHREGSLAAGSCSGVFLLGSAGLLDGRRCTTTWWLHDAFRQRFPKADTAFGSTLIEDGGVITAGGPFSWIHLVLAFLSRFFGADFARRVADFAVVDAGPMVQSAYVPIGYARSQDLFLAEAEHVARQAAPTLGAAGLARSLSVSERTLHRRLKAASGESPGRLLDRVRLDAARTALETGSRPVKQIAEDCGYSDESSFRRAFKRAFGRSPNAYRCWANERALQRPGHD